MWQRLLHLVLSPLLRRLPADCIIPWWLRRYAPYRVHFNKITVPEFSYVAEERFEQDEQGVWWHVVRRAPRDLSALRSYKMDLRKVILENSLKDMDTPRDVAFIKLVEDLPQE